MAFEKVDESADCLDAPLLVAQMAGMLAWYLVERLAESSDYQAVVGSDKQQVEHSEAKKAVYLV